LEIGINTGDIFFQIMINKDAATNDEDLKHYWYNRWKDGFSWLDMANTLRISGLTLRDDFLAAQQRFLQNIWDAASVSREGQTIKIRSTRDILSYRDPKMDLYRAYMSQNGYAIENLFKGIIICGMWLSNPQSIDSVVDFKTLRVPVRGSATQKMPLKTHDLNDLLAAKDMTLTFSNEERKVMRKLTDFILWGGRYPVPIEFDTGDPTFLRVMSPIDESHEHEILEKIYRVTAEELTRLSDLQRDRRPED
jgi:hypothetical protein